MPRIDIVIQTFKDYQSYTFDNGQHVENPEYSYIGSEDPDWLVNPDTFIVHSMFVPADEESGREESFDPTDAKNLLESLGASAHFIRGLPR